MGHLPYPTYICKHSLKSTQSDSLFFNSKEKEISSLLQTKDPWSFTIKGPWPTFTTQNRLIVIGTWVVTLPHFPTPPPRKIVLKRLPNWVPYFGSSIKVSLKETSIWFGILIIPLKRLKLMFESLTF